ncbi:MAG: hypothetical protein ABFC80_06615 [Coriobacteriales bacterium]|nr:hypothetical protein [Actinomycetes bacterium]
MAKTTRLYQQARSPLIQGRSKKARPWGADVARGVVVALPVTFAYSLVLHTGSGLALDVAASRVAADAIPLAVMGLGGGFVGAAIGVSVARAWGSQRAWAAGIACAVVMTVIVAALFVTV